MCRIALLAEERVNAPWWRNVVMDFSMKERSCQDIVSVHGSQLEVLGRLCASGSAATQLYWDGIGKAVAWCAW